MSIVRRYLVASSLARLVRREKGGNRVTEGHFPNQTDRSSYVIVEGEKGSLVLISNGPRGAVEERTEVPRAHAEALLDVTPGKVDYLLTHMMIGTRDIQLVRYVTPGPLDLIVVEFDSEEEARDFRPLSWFGPDVTSEAAYQNRSIALEGAPEFPEVPISNAALNSLLDTLENRYNHGRAYTPAPQARRPADGSAAQGSASAPAQQREPTPAPPQSNPDRPSPRQEETVARGEAPTTVELDGTEDENNDLNIEDNVIRELARSLRPQRR